MSIAQANRAFDRAARQRRLHPNAVLLQDGNRNRKEPNWHEVWELQAGANEPAYGYEMCRKCIGTGFAPDGYSECPYCDGLRGFVVVQRPRGEVYPRCGRCGKYHDPLEFCIGNRIC